MVVALNFDSLAIEPRLRNSWEAIDLGFRLALAHYRPLFLAWLIPASVIALIAPWILQDNTLWALVIIWWLKPLLDRTPLYLASRALFGESQTSWQGLKQIPQTLRIDWAASITWRRFSPARSYHLPVTLLEGLSGKDRSKRLQILDRRSSGAAVWLSIVCLSFEAIIILAWYFFINLLTPDEFNFYPEATFLSLGLFDWMEYILTVFAMAMVGPLYVCAGFLLYINRRIELEAWDVEIYFRKMVKQRTQPQQNTTKLRSLIVVLLVLGTSFSLTPSSNAQDLTDTELLPPAQASAQTLKADEEQKQNAKTLITEVLAGEDFSQTKEVTRWRLRSWNTEDDSDNSADWIINLINKFLDWLASDDEAKDQEIPDMGWWRDLYKVMAALAVLALCGYLLYRYRNVQIEIRLPFKSKTAKPVQPPASQIFGLDVTAESLPEDLPNAVRTEIEKNNYRAALSLLYRATLHQLIHQGHFQFQDSFTEGECVRLVKSSGDARLSLYTEQLTLIWQKLAYGHQAPAPEAIEEYCNQWQELFDRE